MDLSEMADASYSDFKAAVVAADMDSRPRDVVRAFAVWVGMGCHCDTPLEDYLTYGDGGRTARQTFPSTDVGVLASIHNWALHALEDPYEVAVDAWREVGPANVGVRACATQERRD